MVHHADPRGVNVSLSTLWYEGKISLLWEPGSQAANGSHSPLVRHSDWHNQVTSKLRGKGHQQELASLRCTNDQ